MYFISQTDPFLKSILTEHPDPLPVLPSPRQVSDFVQLSPLDFPQPTYPFKDPSLIPSLEALPYMEEEDIKAKRDYLLISKVQKRHRFDLMKHYRYIGLNMVPVDVESIAAREEEERLQE